MHIRVPRSIEDDEDETYHNDHNYGNFDDAGGENYQKKQANIMTFKSKYSMFCYIRDYLTVHPIQIHDNLHILRKTYFGCILLYLYLKLVL